MADVLVALRLRDGRALHHHPDTLPVQQELCAILIAPHMHGRPVDFRIGGRGRRHVIGPRALAPHGKTRRRQVRAAGHHVIVGVDGHGPLRRPGRVQQGIDAIARGRRGRVDRILIIQQLALGRRFRQMRGARVVIRMPRQGHELGQVARLHRLAAQRRVAARQKRLTLVRLAVIEPLTVDAERSAAVVALPLLLIQGGVAHDKTHFDAGAVTPAQAVEQHRAVQRLAGARHGIAAGRRIVLVRPLLHEKILRARQRQQAAARVTERQGHLRRRRRQLRLIRIADEVHDAVAAQAVGRHLAQPVMLLDRARRQAGGPLLQRGGAQDRLHIGAEIALVAGLIAALRINGGTQRHLFQPGAIQVIPQRHHAGRLRRIRRIAGDHPGAALDDAAAAVGEDQAGRDGTIGHVVEPVIVVDIVAQAGTGRIMALRVKAARLAIAAQHQQAAIVFRRDGAQRRDDGARAMAIRARRPAARKRHGIVGQGAYGAAVGIHAGRLGGGVTLHQRLARCQYRARPRVDDQQCAALQLVADEVLVAQVRLAAMLKGRNAVAAQPAIRLLVGQVHGPHDVLDALAIDHAADGHFDRCALLAERVRFSARRIIEGILKNPETGRLPLEFSAAVAQFGAEDRGVFRARPDRQASRAGLARQLHARHAFRAEIIFFAVADTGDADGRMDS